MKWLLMLALSVLAASAWAGQILDLHLADGTLVSRSVEDLGVLRFTSSGLEAPVAHLGEPGGGQILLSWTSVAQATAYHVLDVDAAGVETLLAITTDTHLQLAVPTDAIRRLRVRAHR